MKTSRLIETEACRKEVGLFFYDRRLKLNLSQAELAASLGFTTPQFVSNWERGIALPSSGCLHTLCTLLQISKPQYEKVMKRYINNVAKIESKYVADFFDKGDVDA